MIQYIYYLYIQNQGAIMNTIKVRKNFLIDKNLVEDAQKVILKKHKNLTEAVVKYLQAVVKNPSILDTIEENANKRVGSFIGILDGEIGNIDYKNAKKDRFK